MKTRRSIVHAVFAACIAIATLPPASHAAGFRLFSTGSSSTGEKPQSKLFYHDGSYWAVLEGPDGVSFYEKVGSTWQRCTFPDAVLTAFGKADVKWNGSRLCVLVYDTTVRFFEYVYDTAGRAWMLQAGFPVTVPKPSGAETMALDQDATGRVWATAEGNGDVDVYFSTSADHRSWSSTPVVLQSGIHSDDIASVVAFGGDKIGVFWSDQNRDEFGFRVHHDGDPPDRWDAKESVYAGSGYADDHVHLAFDSSGRVYAVTKDDFDKFAVHRRGVNGGWTTKTDVAGGIGTRPILQVAEQDSKVYVLYTRWGITPHTIQYRVADIADLVFGGQTTFISDTPDVNNITGMKQLLPAGSLMAMAEGGGILHWNGFGAPPSSTTDVAGGARLPGGGAATRLRAMPSPFRGATELRFRLGAPQRVSLAVYDASGRRVATLLDASLAAGEHACRWSGSSDRGGAAGAGVYLAVLRGAGRDLQRKLVLRR